MKRCRNARYAGKSQKFPNLNVYDAVGLYVLGTMRKNSVSALNVCAKM